MTALTPRTYAAPDDETAYRIAAEFCDSNLNHHYNEDAAFVAKQPERPKEMQEAAEEALADMRQDDFESFRKRRRMQTPWFHDLIVRVRPPWNPVESLVLDELNAVIDREELNRRLKQNALRLVTIDMVVFVHEELNLRLKAYGDVIAAAENWDRPTVRLQPESASAAAVQIGEAFDRLTAPDLISKDEIDTVYNAVHRVRIDQGMEVPLIGEISGNSASMVFENAIERLVEYWNSCQDVSDQSAKGGASTRFEPSVQLLVSKYIKLLPNQNDLNAAVQREYSVLIARLSMIQRERKPPPTQSAHEWLAWTPSKNARIWFPSIETVEGWTNFANRFRERGLMKNHPVSGPKKVSINQLVFAEMGVALPNGVPFMKH